MKKRSVVGATLMKTKSPELEPEQCLWKEKFCSQSSVIFKMAPQPCL